MSLYIILDGLFQKVIFKMATGSQFGFWPLARNVGSFVRNREVNLFEINRSQINHQTLVAKNGHRNEVYDELEAIEHK